MLRHIHIVHIHDIDVFSFIGCDLGFVAALVALLAVVFIVVIVIDLVSHIVFPFCVFFLVIIIPHRINAFRISVGVSFVFAIIFVGCSIIVSIVVTDIFISFLLIYRSICLFTRLLQLMVDENHVAAFEFQAIENGQFLIQAKIRQGLVFLAAS